MKSFLGGALALARRPRNDAPVPYVGRGSDNRLSAAWAVPSGQEAQMRAMGAVGTLFAIVNRTSTSTAAVDWELWRKAASGKPEDRVQVLRHAALDLLNKPNAFYSREHLFETSQQHLDLTGEAWWVVASAAGLPLELWPVRPDRMTPVPHRTDFIAGYVYTSPDGEQVPLTREQVIFTKMPNPLDPYRGMGPVQSILVDLDTDAGQRAWNRAFFQNSAEPGGIIEVEKRLSDAEFAEMVARWQEQHRGVHNAHRVAVIEQGKWVDRNLSQRDMQFVEGAQVTRDAILLAFGMPKFALGVLDDVNRSSAAESDRWFDKHLTVTRLERWKGSLNQWLLPLFGAAARGLEFDYVNPVAEDKDADNADRDSRVSAAVALIGTGRVDPVSVLAEFGLDAIGVVEPELVAVPEPVPAREDLALAARHRVPLRALPANRHRWPRAAEPDLDPAELPDVQPLQDDWEEVLAALLVTWAVLAAAQKLALVDAIASIARSGRLADLTGIDVDTTETAAALAAAMESIAESAAGRLVTEAAEQGVSLDPVLPGGLSEVADVVADQLATQLRTSATSAALRANGPAATPEEIADAVTEALDALTDAEPARQLGAALTGAQNAARVATLAESQTVGAIYAVEKNDRAACLPCSEINGRWLGNTDDLAQVFRSYPGGAYGGYVGCLGRERCRGTICGVWR